MEMHENALQPRCKLKHTSSGAKFCCLRNQPHHDAAASAGACTVPVGVGVGLQLYASLQSLNMRIMAGHAVSRRA